MVINNVFDTITDDDAVIVPKWGTYDGSRSSETDNNTIAFNTIINAAAGAVELDRAWGVNPVTTNPPTNTKIYSNILVGSAGTLIKDASSSDPLPVGTDISHNIFWGAALPGLTGANALLGDPEVNATTYVPAANLGLGNAKAVSGVTRDYYFTTRSATPDHGAVER